MNRIAVVTGATSGMGRETVIQLADRFGGLEEIWVIGRREERLIYLAQEVPVKLRCFPLNLEKQEDLEKLKRVLTERRPNVKLLVNAAGYGKMGGVGEVEPSQETGMVRVNCEALVAVTSMVLPYMSKNSRIIQFASAAAFVPQPDFAVYAATKAFVLSFSRALNEELRSRKICVTAVCPGPVKTEFFEIAESTGEIPLYKRLAMADCRKVVDTALKDSMMGKSVSIYGIWMKLIFAACKLIPHAILLNLMGKLSAQRK